MTRGREGPRQKSDGGPRAGPFSGRAPPGPADGYSLPRIRQTQISHFGLIVGVVGSQEERARHVVAYEVVASHRQAVGESVINVIVLEKASDRKAPLSGHVVLHLSQEGEELGVVKLGNGHRRPSYRARRDRDVVVAVDVLVAGPNPEGGLVGTQADVGPPAEG